MKTLRLVGRAVLVGVVFLVAQAIAAWLVPMAPMAQTPHLGLWMLSTFIAALTLTVVALRSSWRGWRLAGAVALVPLAIQLANLTEGVFFLKNTAMAIGPLMLRTVIAYVLAIPALVPVLSGSRSAADIGEQRASSAGGVLWRFAVCDVSYLFLYYLAGIIIYSSFPHVRAFYEGQGGTPPVEQVVAMQVLVRGPIFVGLCVLLTAMVRLPRAAGALAVGLAFTVLSGVVPLLVPNPFMPDAVRWVHFGEVVSSNLVFGMIVGWLWGRARAVEPAQEVSPRAPLPV
jgi:hypothetical protein